jgi:hypothetical protein
MQKPHVSTHHPQATACRQYRTFELIVQLAL